jgi:hypothetical protein
MVQIVKRMKRNKVIKIIDNATVSSTVVSPDIDMREFANMLITYAVTGISSTPTMDIVFQIKDSNGNYITHTVLQQITAISSGYEEIFDLAASTGRIVCTYGGSGNFATTTVEVTLAA